MTWEEGSGCGAKEERLRTEEERERAAEDGQVRARRETATEEEGWAPKMCAGEECREGAGAGAGSGGQAGPRAPRDGGGRVGARAARRGGAPARGARRPAGAAGRSARRRRCRSRERPELRHPWSLELACAEMNAVVKRRLGDEEAADARREEEA